MNNRNSESNKTPEDSKSLSKKLDEARKSLEDLRAEFKEEQEKNLEAKKYDDALISSIGEGLYVTDAYGHITRVNPTALEILQCEEKDLLGKWVMTATTLLERENGDPIEPMDRPMTRAFQTGQAISENLYIQRKNGTVLPIFITVSPVLIEGNPVGAITVFRDVSKERELEKAKDEFVSLASHQLRTPATGVKAFASMLLDGYAGKMTDQQVQFLNQLYESNERQLRIIEDLLSVARVESGRIVLERKTIDLRTIVQGILTEQDQVIKSRDQRVIFNQPVTPVNAYADAEKVRMIADNLVSNASKYTKPGGKITITLKQMPPIAELTVEDNGVGIAKANHSKLFQRFSRIDNPLSTIVGGSGLGLYMVKHLVDLHGGQITMQSQLNKGSTFKVLLPMEERRKTRRLEKRPVV